MKNLLTILLVFFSASASVSAQVKPFSYWLNPTMSEEQARDLARFDVVIADMENMVNNLASLRTIQKINPDVKLICYSNPMETFANAVANRPIQTEWAMIIHRDYPAWELKTGSGDDAVFYEGMRMYNMSSDCPRMNGKSYVEWMAEKLIDEVLSTEASPDGRKLWDGYIEDNCTPTISWVSPRDQFDIDGDGKADSPEIVDRSWYGGNKFFLTRLRQEFGKKFILLGNKGVTEYADLLDGRLFEWFPNDYLGNAKDGGWWQSMINAAQTGPYTLFLLSPKDVLFGVLSSLLLNNVYIGVGNSTTRWFPEYDLDLGTAGDISIIRKFSGGEIEINPSRRKGEVIK